MASRDELKPLLPAIFCIERPDGRTFTLQLAGGQEVLPVCTSLETAMAVRDLLVEKRLGGPFRVCEMQVPRETFESVTRPEGTNRDKFVFVYEGEELFDQVIVGLKNYQPPA
jgi:hypothetical protein